MNPELWATFGAGAPLAALQWRLYAGLNANLNTRTDRIDHIEANLTGIRERLSRIEGWVVGLYGEEPARTV